MNFRQTLKLGKISCSSTSKSNTSRTFFKNEFYHLKLHLVIQHSPSCMYDILVSLLPNYLCLACCYHIKTLACWASKNLGSTLSDIPCTIWRKKNYTKQWGSCIPSHQRYSVFYAIVKMCLAYFYMSIFWMMGSHRIFMINLVHCS